MRSLGLALLATWMTIGRADGQADPAARNRLSFEALGSGLVYSLNYERSLGPVASFRIGAGGWPAPGAQYLVAFGGLGARIGSPQHSLHLGAGGGVGWAADVDVFETENEVGGYGYGAAGYQFQPGPTGFFLRLSWTPAFSATTVEPLWGGLMLGVAF